MTKSQKKILSEYPNLKELFDMLNYLEFSAIEMCEYIDAYILDPKKVLKRVRKIYDKAWGGYEKK